MPRKSTVDKRDEESKKRGRRKKGSSDGSSDAVASGRELVAAEKPQRPKKSAAERAAEQEKAEKLAAKGARKALRHAVKKAVKEKCDEIAQALVEGTEKGNMRSTAMMLSMIEKKKDGDGSERHGGLTAADLAGSEEEWEGEVQGSGVGDQGSGTRD